MSLPTVQKAADSDEDSVLEAKLVEMRAGLAEIGKSMAENDRILETLRQALPRMSATNREVCLCIFAMVHRIAVSTMNYSVHGLNQCRVHSRWHAMAWPLSHRSPS